MAQRRPVRIGNCSGAAMDPGEMMLTQATAGQIDVITGDYLAEANMADSAEAHGAGQHPGWTATALDGLRKSLAAVHERGVKVVVNGGALNPRGLAEEVDRLARERGLVGLRVGWVDGDDLLPRVRELLLRPGPDRAGLPHLDAANPHVRLAANTDSFLHDEDKKIVAANAYLGCRAIRRGLDEGADVIICGRVADASPVMGAAAWWHGWKEDQWDELAGALLAGHLIECSTYGTGGNFAGFDDYPVSELVGLGCPIAEVAANGDCVITKHESVRGIVNEEVVKCQLLYELQGNIYLNSDVKADLASVRVEQVAENRVYVTRAKGHPPPPTTKLAVFYRAGYQGTLTINATGYATARKYDLQEAHIRRMLKEWGVEQQIELLEFQRVGVPDTNPRSQLAATTYLRVFIQASTAHLVRSVFAAFMHTFMQHFPGMACELAFKSVTEPQPFLGYFPAVVRQDEIREAVNLIGDDVTDIKRFEVGPPKAHETLAPRESYDPIRPRSLTEFGPTKLAPIGDVVLARSGDKGGNVNVGFTPRRQLNNDETWEWLRSLLTINKIKDMMGDDWQEWYHIERVEFPHIRSVHFVVYGALARGVSSSARIDSLGKGFAEFLRSVHVPVPVKFLNPADKAEV